MKTIEINVYQYQDLIENPEVKERALNYMRSNFNFMDFYTEELQGSYSAVKEIIDQMPEELEDNRLRTWIVNNLSNLWIVPCVYYKTSRTKGKTYFDITKYDGGIKRVSNVTYTEASCPFTGVCYDDDLLKVIKDFIEYPKGDKEYILLALESKYRKLYEDTEQFVYSEEYLLDSIQANEYEFTEDGKPV